MVDIRRISLTFAVATLVSCTHMSVVAMECTRPPETDLRNYQADFEAAAAKVVAIRGPSVNVAIKSEARSLLEKMPNSDKALVDLTLLYALCTALRDDSSLPERDKAKLMAAYGQALRVPPTLVTKKTTQSSARPNQPVATAQSAEKPINPLASIHNNSAPVLNGNSVGGNITITTTQK